MITYYVCDKIDLTTGQGNSLGTPTDTFVERDGRASMLVSCSPDCEEVQDIEAVHTFVGIKFGWFILRFGWDTYMMLLKEIESKRANMSAQQRNDCKSSEEALT